jgi:SAM-dependent methyltransferase
LVGRLRQCKPQLWFDAHVARPYLLPQGDELERRRLELLQLHHDPDSIAALERTGVGAGWRCLDVGAGAGSISRWLVGRGAEVLATDLDISSLGGLDARVHDVTSDEPLPAPFDLVHTRLLLLHLPEREAVARKLAGFVRLGGWMVAGDIDFTPVQMVDPSAAWTRTWAAWCAAIEAAGWDLACGTRLAGMLRDAGLTDVRAESRGVQGPGGSVPLVILSLALEKLRARLTEHGASDADVTAAREALEDPAFAFTAPVTWTASGVLPGA